MSEIHFVIQFLLCFLLLILSLVVVGVFDRFIWSFYRQKWRLEEATRKRDMAVEALKSLVGVLRIDFLSKLNNDWNCDKLLPYKGDHFDNPLTKEEEVGSCETYLGRKNGSNNKWKGRWQFPKDCKTLIAYINTLDEVYCPKERRKVTKPVMYMRCKCENCKLERNVEGFEYAKGVMDKEKKIPRHPRMCPVCMSKEKLRKEEERLEALKTEIKNTEGIVVHHAHTCYLCLDNEATLCLSTCTENHMSANGPIPIMCKGCARKLVGKKGVFKDEQFRNCPLCRKPFGNMYIRGITQKAFVGTPEQMKNRY